MYRQIGLFSIRNVLVYLSSDQIKTFQRVDDLNKLTRLKNGIPSFAGISCPERLLAA